MSSKGTIGCLECLFGHTDGFILSQAYTVAQESGPIITDELAGVVGKAAKGEQTDAGSVEFSIRANHAIREATALVSLESSPVLELAIQLPAAWPLQDAKLDCRKGVRFFAFPPVKE